MMLILDTTTLLNDGIIEIPSYHVGHLSLKSGTQVTTCLLSDKVTTAPQLYEIVVTPIVFDSWQYLTRVSATFNNQPGVVRKLTHALWKAELDILYEESASVELGRYHRVELLVDARKAYEQFDESLASDQIVLSSLERRFKAICLNELIFDGIRPRLKVRRMEGLREAWKQHSQSRNCIWERCEIQGCKLSIPEPIIGQIPQVPPQRAMIVSDTKERLLRLLFPIGDVDFTYIRVVHKDCFGALAQITHELSKGFDCLLTLTRLKKQAERNDIELLLYSPEYPHRDDAKERKKIAEHLLSDESLAHLQLTVSYPSRSGAKGPVPRPPVSSVDRKIELPSSLTPLEAELCELSTTKVLKHRCAELHQLRDVQAGLGIGESIRRRSDAAKALLTQEGDETIPLPKIFVSYNFAHESLHDVVRNLLSDEKVEAVNGRNPNEGDRFRNVIRDRIVTCDGFIGIWKGDREETFSPWLLWELGVAQAFKIPYRLYVHKELEASPHTKIIPETHHESFEDVFLKETVQGQLPKFLEEVRERDRRRVSERLRTSLDYDVWAEV